MDAGRGRGRGGFAGGDKGGPRDMSRPEFYPHTGNAVFDGKRMRKAVKRPTVDYHSSMIKQLEVQFCF